MQTLIFDSRGFKGRLRACLSLGTYHALLCEEVLVLERLVAIWSGFLQKQVLGTSFSGVRYKQLVRIAVNRCFLRNQAGLDMPCRAMGAGGMRGCEGAPWSNKVDGKELHGATGGDLDSRESTIFFTSSTWSTRLSPSTSVVLCLF